MLKKYLDGRIKICLGKIHENKIEFTKDEDDENSKWFPVDENCVGVEYLHEFNDLMGFMMCGNADELEGKLVSYFVRRCMHTLYFEDALIDGKLESEWLDEFVDVEATRNITIENMNKLIQII